MNSFDFFEEIYLINLDSRKDKLENSYKECRKVSIDKRIQRFSAIQHEKGAIGCAKSHIEIIKIAKNKNLRNVLILEDDISFENNCLEILEKSIQQLPENFQMFYLGINPLFQQSRISENLVKIKGGFTTHCYAINSNFYDIILNNFSIPIDVFYSQLHRKYDECYCTFPLIAGQRNEYSDIEKVQCDNGSHIKERYYRLIK